MLTSLESNQTSKKSSLYRQTYLEINLEAIANNVKTFSRLLPEGAELMAIVKADGYGHGAIPVLKQAISAGVGWAGVALVEEALEIRNAGIDQPVLLLGSWSPSSLDVIFNNDITPVIHSNETAELVQNFLEARNEIGSVHLKVDTGMGRMGFSEKQLTQFVKDQNRFKNLKIAGFMSHYSSADEGDDTFSLSQLERFKACYEVLKNRHQIDWVHISNSAGISEITGDIGNLFRLGIGMYGQPPSPDLINPQHLEEAITWKSSVVQLQWHEKGSPISYGRTYHTTGKTLVATICVGYADGYSRRLSNNSDVLIQGRRVPVIGRVCMDMIMIDVTSIKKDVQVEDEVVLIGAQGSERITATEMAETLGTINYEITCNISKRTPRIYK